MEPSKKSTDSNKRELGPVPPPIEEEKEEPRPKLPVVRSNEQNQGLLSHIRQERQES